ncbi:MAG: beta-lactamase family protein [Caulobacteraceae bacterium]|nr:beta-lactamase family protein [Caulobacter sp.]
MSASPPVADLLPDVRFAGVRAAFQRNLDEGLELGVRFAAHVDGRPVVDLVGGFADRTRTTPFTARTLAPVFSVSKAMTAVMMARLVEQGRLAYDQPVADVWPEFGQAGKGAVTVGQALSHQAGLSGFPDAMDPADWFDHDLICARLAAMEPLWPPGTASGYHPLTFGYIAGEIFRRVDGRSLGRALRADVAEPLGLDLWIGLPEGEDGRVAQLQKPDATPRFGEINTPTRAAFLTKWAAPAGRPSAEWRRAEMPASNGHATAAALSRLMAALACGGAIDGVRILSPEGVAAMARARICGDDLVLKNYTCWGAGVMRNEGRFAYGPGAQTFGHSGWGGACAFADPERRVAGAYVMTKQSSDLVGDPRSKRLIAALYEAL